METVFLLLFVGAACWLGALPAERVLAYAADAVGALSDSIEENRERFREQRAWSHAERWYRSRRRRYRRWVESRMGMPRDESSIDPDVMEARRLTPILRRLAGEELPEAVRACVLVHRLAAQASGVVYIHEIGDMPECFGLRERVLATEEFGIDLFETYPLPAAEPRLIKALTALRRSRNVCGECPYLEFRAAQAPLLCPSAEIVGIKPESVQDDNHR